MYGDFPAFETELRGRRCLRTFVTLDASALDVGTNSGWAHVAMLGDWKGHSKGPFSFTGDAFGQILKNFSAQSNPIPWDYEHDTFSNSTGPKPASGWVRRLELRANGTELWAYVDWTPRAADMIRAGEYRFCSPVVDFESIDRRTNETIGAELLSVALTNNPFLDGQHPIQLSWTAAAFPPPQDDKNKPGQPPPFPPKDGGQAAEPKGPPQAPPPHGQQAPQHPPPPAAAADDPNKPKPMDAVPPPPAPIEQPSTDAADAALGNGAEADANAFLSALADAAGVDKSQTLAALLDMKDLLVNQIQKTIARDGTPAEATRTMTTEKKPETQTQPAAAAVTTQTPPVAAAPPVTTEAALSLDDIERKRDKERLEEMQTRLAKLEAERAEEKKAAIAQLVDEKIATGHVKPDQRETAIWAFTTDRARAEQIYADKVVPIATRQSLSKTTVTNTTAAAANGGGSGDELDESHFSRAELMTIQCLMGAHQTRKNAVAIVLAKRAGSN